MKGGPPHGSKKIGAFLRTLRTEKGLTQEQLAEKLNVAGRTVSRWETGSNMPDLSIIVELADYYDVDIRELLNGERKSENMNEDLKETLEMVSEYTAAEKQKLMKELREYSVIFCLFFIAIFVINAFRLERLCSELEAVSIWCAMMGAGFSVACIFKWFQLSGKISKMAIKRIVIVVMVLLVIALFAMIGSILLLIGVYRF